MKNKKNQPQYDEKGRWVEERTRIKGAIRRAFRLSPQMREVLKEARVELSPALKKDGLPGKRPQVRYTCSYCLNLFSQKNVQVDHVETVVPLWRKEEVMSYDEIVRGVFCHKDNLQVLCSTPIKRNNGVHSCHKKKTDKENWIRRYLFDKYPDNENERKMLLENKGHELKSLYTEYLQAKEAEKNAKRNRKRKIK